MDTEFLFGMVKKFWNPESGDGCTTVGMCLLTQNYKSRISYSGKCDMHVLPH